MAGSRTERNKGGRAIVAVLAAAFLAVTAVFWSLPGNALAWERGRGRASHGWGHGRYGRGYYRPHRSAGYWRAGPGFGVAIRGRGGYFGLRIGPGPAYYPPPRRYVVVEREVTVAPPSASVLGGVRVAVGSLNLRRGPGAGYGVVSVVEYDTELAVLASEGGWLYVQTPGGLLGWVHSGYTSGIYAAPNG